MNVSRGIMPAIFSLYAEIASIADESSAGCRLACLNEYLSITQPLTPTEIPGKRPILPDLHIIVETLSNMSRLLYSINARMSPTSKIADDSTGSPSQLVPQGQYLRESAPVLVCTPRSHPQYSVQLGEFVEVYDNLEDSAILGERPKRCPS